MLEKRIVQADQDATMERNEHTLRSVQMIESLLGEKRVTSVSPEPDRNGMTMKPAETLLVLCLLAQRAQRHSRPETELYVPARPAPTAWKPGAENL